VANPRGHHLIVIADRDDVEIASPRFGAQIPCSQRAVTWKSMHVEIAG
jgi:hypothetical protein